MKAIATILVAMLALLVGASAFGQETTIQVPQGSGVFPTVGQVNCLEELGTGRLCAATYDCSGDSGRLWGDLANHNGRRAIGKDSPVARGRDCTITIDGRAAVRWLTAYSPGGRTGELVGLTTSEDALRPVVRGGSTGTGGGGQPLLDWILNRYNMTITEYTERQCDHLVPGSGAHQACISGHLINAMSSDSQKFNYWNDGSGPVYHDDVDYEGGLLEITADPVAQCLVVVHEQYCRERTEQNCDNDHTMVRHLLANPELYSLASALFNWDWSASDRWGHLPYDFAAFHNDKGKPCLSHAMEKLRASGINALFDDDGDFILETD